MTLMLVQERLKEADDRITWLSEKLEKENLRSLALPGAAPSPMHGEAERAILEMRRRLERVERERDTLAEELDNCLGESCLCPLEHSGTRRHAHKRAHMCTVSLPLAHTPTYLPARTHSDIRLYHVLMLKASSS